LDTYKTDEEQIESLKKWWEENGTSIVLGIVIGFGAIFGWRWWQQEKLNEAEAASRLFQSMMEISQDADSSAIRDKAEELISDYGSTTYAVFAKMMLAKIAVQENDYQSAEEHLRGALENVGEQSIEHEIRLRLARVLIARDEYEEASRLLDIGDPGQFAADYSELRGDISLYQGDREGARQAYQEAVAHRRITGGETAILDLKLEDLGHPSL